MKNFLGVCNMIKGGATMEDCIASSLFGIDDMQEMKDWLKNQRSVLTAKVDQLGLLKDKLMDDVTHYNEMSMLYNNVNEESMETYRLIVEEVMGIEAQIDEIQDSITRNEDLITQLTNELLRQESYPVARCPKCGMPLNQVGVCTRCDVPVFAQ